MSSKNIDKNFHVVYEVPTEKDRVFIYKYIKQNMPVWIIEPFYAYHHKKGIRFFPPDLPPYILELLSTGKMNFIKSEELNAKEIYFFAADKAIDVIESVFPEYKKGHSELFKYVSDTLKSSVAENIFKKDLCNRLAEFYSINILLHRIEKFLGTGPILFYPDTNVLNYLYFKSLLSKSKQDYYEHPDIRFPIRTKITAFSENLKEYLVTIAKLLAQTLASGLLGSSKISNKKERKSYLYGVAVVAPLRQLTDNQRGPSFIIDDDKIHAEDVIYFPLVDLTDSQKKQLANLPGSVYYPPKVGQYFSHFSKWTKLFWLAFKNNFLCNTKEINVTCNAFFNYFKWLKVMGDIEFRHFISHSDFGIGHIGRNLALNQAGVQTWYFTDSMNMGCNYQDSPGRCGVRHPFWTYLYYDHFVTWDELLVRYFKEHPGTFKQVHVVGCLWGGHINNKNQAKNPSGRSVRWRTGSDLNIEILDMIW